MSGTETLSDLKEKLIKVFEEGWGRKGAESVKGRIVALVYLSPTELTQEEISRSIINESTKKHYSRSQISRHLKDLVHAGVLARRSKPGTKIQLYTSRRTSSFDNFQQLLIERQAFFSKMVKIIDDIDEKWDSLSESSKTSIEGKKFKEVTSNYSKMTHITLDIIQDYIQRFNSRMTELKNEGIEKSGK
ncbi:MAG: hypothetical protein ACXAC8_05760 [Candidatus Hodarchaeales archaeon]|jgi:DNA-binding transcriptional regulator GbsR (MarR family)